MIRRLEIGLRSSSGSPPRGHHRRRREGMVRSLPPHQPRAATWRSSSYTRARNFFLGPVAFAPGQPRDRHPVPLRLGPHHPSGKSMKGLSTIIRTDYRRARSRRFRGNPRGMGCSVRRARPQRPSHGDPSRSFSGRFARARDERTKVNSHASVDSSVGHARRDRVGATHAGRGPRPETPRTDLARRPPPLNPRIPRIRPPSTSSTPCATTWASVQAEGIGDGRTTMSLTNRTRRSLRVASKTAT